MMRSDISIPLGDRGQSATAGCGEQDGEHIGMAVVHRNFPGFAINCQCMFLFPVIRRELTFFTNP